MYVGCNEIMTVDILSVCSVLPRLLHIILFHIKRNENRSKNKIWENIEGGLSPFKTFVRLKLYQKFRYLGNLHLNIQS